jgi:hypothetical protein
LWLFLRPAPSSKIQTENSCHSEEAACDVEDETKYTGTMMMMMM